MRATSLEGKFSSTGRMPDSARILLAATLSVALMLLHAAELHATSASIHTSELLGRWGLASFENPADRAVTERAARAQCRLPYVIHAGRYGGLMMNQADQTTPQELWLKDGPGGKTYLGPRGPAPGEQDREIVWYGRQVMITRFVEKNAAVRYGNMVYVRCKRRGP